MPIKKDLTKKLDRLVHYIEEHSINEGWVTLTYRDIAKIVKTASGSSITKRLMESLKEHENILYKLDFNPKKSKKPLQFRFVDKEVKFAAIDNKRYINLTTEEVDYIKEKLGYKNHADIYNVLAYINYLKSEYKDEPFDLPQPCDVSDILLILEQDIVYINEFLANNHILVDTNGKYSLSLKQVGTENTDNSDEDSIVFEMPKQAQPISNEHLDELSITGKMELYNKLKAQQNELATQQDLLINQLKQDVEKETLRISKMQNQLDEGHELMQKLVLENQELHEKVKQLETYNSKLNANYEHSIRFKDDLIKATQESLEIFYWQVQQIALSDSKQSTAIKNTMSYRANLAKEFTDVGNAFYNSILNFKKD